MRGRGVNLQIGPIHVVKKLGRHRGEKNRLRIQIDRSGFYFGVANVIAIWLDVSDELPCEPIAELVIK